MLYLLSEIKFFLHSQKVLNTLFKRSVHIYKLICHYFIALELNDIYFSFQNSNQKEEV